MIRPISTFAREHEPLVQLCLDLAARASVGEWKICDLIWGELAKKLEGLLLFEERELFTAFLAAHPEHRLAIAELEAEHEELRRALEQMGTSVRMQELGEGQVRTFVAQLRRHVAVETSAFYPWVPAREARAHARPLARQLLN